MTSWFTFKMTRVEKRGGAVESKEETITLWRPVDAVELRLIEESGFEAFPPRLPEQPIFYPVVS